MSDMKQWITFTDVQVDAMQYLIEMNTWKRFLFLLIKKLYIMPVHI